MGDYHQPHPATHPASCVGGVIHAILPGSIAADLGLCAGDIVLAVGNQPLRDTIDYHFAITEEQIDLWVQTKEGVVVYEIEKERDEDVGIIFANPLFERLQTCVNKCPFCFVSNMPKGMRRSLYLKDDDYRLSFLDGTFVTLTNLTERDWQRIEQQRLSPLYVSVHATDHALRRRLLGNPAAPDILAQLQRLRALGITVHTQIVVCPGVNDGAVLLQTIADLAEFFPTIRSIAVVPVGLTRYAAASNWGFCGRLPSSDQMSLRCYSADEARALLAKLRPIRRNFRKRLGIDLVYPADEWYLLSGIMPPPAYRYDGFPQYANGVGMTRDLLEDWRRLRRRLRQMPPPRRPLIGRIALVCGTLIAPILHPIVTELAAWSGADIILVPVVNQFFGETVTVSGLLVGQDVATTLRAMSLTHAMLPRVMFNHAGLVTLDDYSLADLESASGITLSVHERLDQVVKYVNVASEDMATDCARATS